MANENEKVPKKRGKLKVSHVLLILLLVGIAAFALFRLRSKSTLRARMNAIRAAGHPVTWVELDEWYTIPYDAENAADTLIDAFSYYSEPNETEAESLPVIGRGKLPARTEPMAEEMKTLLAQYIAANHQALELLHAGAAMEHSRYPVDFTAGFNALMPYLKDVRQGGKLLALEAILHAENDNSQSATRSVISGFGVAHSLAAEPMVISQLVRLSCRALVLSGLERAVNRSEFTDEQLTELSQTIAEAEDRSTMVRAFAGERCQVLTFLREPASLDAELIGAHVPARPILELYKALGLADMDAIIYLDLMNDYIETAQLALHQRQDAAAAIEAKLRSISKIHLLLHLWMPAFSRIITIELRGIAQLRSARVGVAVQRYRLAAGELPDTLADLVPNYLKAVPKDPFDGNELRYKRLETGFVVYSIGEDLSDDGGKEKPLRRTKESPNWDVTFIVER